MKSLKIANGQPEAVNRSRIDNTIVNRKGKTKQKGRQKKGKTKQKGRQNKREDKTKGKTKQKGRQNKREDKTKEINPKNTKHKTKG
jgi:hypothetical protein